MRGKGWGALVEGGGRVSPRRARYFSLLRQRKVPKRKATLLSATPSLRCGATCGARCWRGLARTHAYGAQTIASPDPPSPVRRRRSQKGRESQTSTRAIAALGPACAARGARRLRPRDWGRAQRWPVGCLDVFSPPHLAAPAAGRLRGEHARRSAHASLSDSPWLSERSAPARSEFHGAPRHRTDAGLPRRGRRLWVAFSLLTFFWRSKRK